MGWAGDAISGCQCFLQKKRYFPAAWELFRIWKREEPLCQAPPLTGPTVFALCATAFAWNLTDVALLIAIGFGGILRTMEALTLQRFQITAHNSFSLLTLPATKTGKRTGETQSVVVDDPLLVSIINCLLCLLCPSVSHHFCFLFRALQLDQFHFTLCSLRRGGATTHCMLFRNMDATIEKGRWSCVQTARIYSKESIAVCNSLSIPAHQLAYFDQLGHAMLDFLYENFVEFEPRNLRLLRV